MKILVFNGSPKREKSDTMRITRAFLEGMALLVCLAVFVGLAWRAGARSFPSAFLSRYGLWLLVDWYDCFFLDWVLFANLKRIRLPGTEHMDSAYHQKLYHARQSANGMALGLIPCLLCGMIDALLVE